MTWAELHAVLDAPLSGNPDVRVVTVIEARRERERVAKAKLSNVKKEKIS